MILDGFKNFLSALGGSNPKTAANTYALGACNPMELEAAYRTSPWLGKVIEIPADDSVREWRQWQADEPQVEALEATEQRLDVPGVLRQALVTMRLHGGAAIIVGGLPGAYASALSMDRMTLGGIQFLTVLAPHEITCGEIDRNPLSAFYGKPSYYEVVGERVHPSRVIHLAARRRASRLLDATAWGDPVWLSIRDAVAHVDAGSAVIAALMQEAKLDIIKQPNLMSGMMTAEYESRLINRYRLMGSLKSVANVTLLDGDDEWEQRQVTWAGLPDVQRLLIEIMAGAADIPVTRLLGTSAVGLNATGEGDLKNYYDMIGARQKLDLTPALTPLDEMLIRDALGTRPPDVWYSWRPLWQTTEKEQAEIDKLQAETVSAYINTGLFGDGAALAVATRNRMVESGAWPGLEAAVDEFPIEVELPSAEELAAAEAEAGGAETDVDV